MEEEEPVEEPVVEPVVEPVARVVEEEESWPWWVSLRRDDLTSVDVAFSL